MTIGVYIARDAEGVALYVGSSGNIAKRLSQHRNRPAARVGRCFALAQERGWIEFVRLTKSSDKGTHGKRINVYRPSP